MIFNDESNNCYFNFQILGHSFNIKHDDDDDDDDDDYHYYYYYHHYYYYHYYISYKRHFIPAIFSVSYK